MKSTVLFPIDKGTKLLVVKGDKVEAGAIIGEKKIQEKKETLAFASLLKVSPSQIFKFLKKKVGDKVNEGEVLAEKKTFFSSTVIRAPFAGVLKEVNLKDGTLSFFLTEETLVEKLTFPFSGKILKVEKTYLEIEIDGEVYKLSEARGEAVCGKLEYFSSDSLSVLDIKDEVEKKVVLAKFLTPEAGIKLEVMGALGIVVEKKGEEFTLPWGRVDSYVFKKLAAYHGKQAWLRPKEKEIVVCL